VPTPAWVKMAIDTWTQASAITEGRIFRAINRGGLIWGEGMSSKVIWEVVKTAANEPGSNVLLRTTFSPVPPEHLDGNARYARVRCRLLASRAGGGGNESSQQAEVRKTAGSEGEPGVARLGPQQISGAE